MTALSNSFSALKNPLPYPDELKNHAGGPRFEHAKPIFWGLES